MNEQKLLVFHEPDEEAFQPIVEGIQRYGIEAIGGREPKKLGVLIKSHGGDVVGGGIGHEILDVFYLTHLWVAPEHRGQGLGGVVLTAIEREAAALGCHELRLDTMNARSLPFYARHGYDVYARIPEYVPGFERVFLRKPGRKI